ncbi:MAG TPA: serine hydrolase domain-containing protein [Nitrospirales bacterium]|nr:serine hydrolase domain-containing protein [Nitrospirales bacterium]
MPTADPIAEPIIRAVDDAVADQVFPGAVLHVRRGGRTVLEHAAGYTSHGPDRQAVIPSTLYDLASLTKPLAATTAALQLVRDGRIGLEDPITVLLPELSSSETGRATLRQLLNHSAGLPGWRPLFERMPAASERIARPERESRMLALIAAEPLEYTAGTKSLYSDLGFMLLGIAVARAAGEPLETYCMRQIFAPLGATPLAYRPIGESTGGVPPERIAPTEYAQARGRLLHGEVHDDNAAALGGVAGHAGLFGAAAAVATMGSEWLAASRGEPSRWPMELVRAFVTRQQTPGSSWALGWDTPSAPSSSGRYFSPTAFGHLGFTGTSLWIDPEADLVVVLLSNRVQLRRDNTKIQAFRPLIHDLVHETFGGKRRSGQAGSG